MTEAKTKTRSTKESGPGQSPEDMVLADWNADVPTESDYAVKAWIDNNDVRGVAVDMNQERPTGVPEKPEPPEPVEPEPDPRQPDDERWIGTRISGENPGLPHSVYQDPDMTRKDPEDLPDQDPSLVGKVREDLAEQAEELEEKKQEEQS